MTHMAIRIASYRVTSADFTGSVDHSGCIQSKELPLERVYMTHMVGHIVSYRVTSADFTGPLEHSGCIHFTQLKNASI